MIFSTYQFILVFLPIVFAGYYILNGLKFKNISKIWLVLASLYFYAQGSPNFFPYFLASIVANYVVRKYAIKNRKENFGKENIACNRCAWQYSFARLL